MNLPKHIPLAARVIASISLLLLALLAFKSLSFVESKYYNTLHISDTECYADGKTFKARNGICYSIDIPR